MSNLKRELLVNTKKTFDYLSIYGVDKNNSKEDIAIISFIEEILDQNCYYDLLTEVDFINIKKVISTIKNKNPMFVSCLFDISDYKNLGGKQNIKTYQIIK